MSELRIDRNDTVARVSLGDVVVAEYSATSDASATDTPKPFMHPLRTPAGVTVTGFAPEDHPWHHGLQFAFPRVGPHNLWGGGTYLGPDRGYVVLEDQGSIRHERWLQSPAATIAHEVLWLGHDEERLLSEERSWSFAVTGDALVVDFGTVIRNITDGDLVLETPAQRGRSDGGYGGLFLRLAEDFSAERLVGDDGDIVESGAESNTLVVHGRTKDGDAVTLGLSFGDAPGNRNWLYRFDPFSAIGWAIAYHDGLALPMGGELAFGHRLVLLDGHVAPEAVRALL